MMRNCSCGGTLETRVIDMVDLTGLTALGEVHVVGRRGLVCDRCGEKTFSGKTMALIHLSLVRFLLGVERRLTNKEVRFLREWMGITQADFADRLGVNRVTVANWERGHKAASRTASFMIRSLVTGHLLGHGLVTGDDGQELARDALAKAWAGGAPDDAAQYVVNEGAVRLQAAAG